MVNVINNSMLHTYAEGSVTSVMYTITPELTPEKYDSCVAQIIEINKCVPCSLSTSLKSKSIYVCFYFNAVPDSLKSARISIDFNLVFRSDEEFFTCFASIYNYIVQVVGYSVSDMFKASDSMPFVSEEKDSLYVRIKPNMLTISDNNTIVIDFPKMDI
jgi:hypothetical protein